MLNIPTIHENIQKGSYAPHLYLTNLCLSYLQSAEAYVSRQVFPIVPVAAASSHYYVFDKGDLARDNMSRKPEMGHVTPAVFGSGDQFYHCQVDQVITGLDKFSLRHQQRTMQGVDPRKAKVRFIAEQMNIHLDRIWADSYFKEGVWGLELEGTDSVTDSSREHLYFDLESCDPVAFFESLRTKMLLQGLRKPNKLVLGSDVYSALRSNPSVLERIKYQGSQANPASVNTNVLAQLFGLEQVVVSEAVYNKAPLGAEAEMDFICSPDAALLCYTTDAPSLEEPSAGYTFAWDMLGNGQYTAVRQFDGRAEDHSEFIEGLLCTDCKVTSPDLGVFFTGAVSPAFREQP